VGTCACFLALAQAFFQFDAFDLFSQRKAKPARAYQISPARDAAWEIGLVAEKITFAECERLARCPEDGQTFPRQISSISGTFGNAWDFSSTETIEEIAMKYALIFATVAALATPALAEEAGVGVGVGPVGAGVTVGQSRDHDRDRERTVIKEREPSDRTTIIKKEHDDAEPRTKTIIKERE
jgi:hypothetical protein